MDRPLVVTLWISLTCHTVFVGAQLFSRRWTNGSELTQSFKVTYDHRAAEQEYQLSAQQLSREHARLAQLSGPVTARVAGWSGGSAHMEGILRDTTPDELQHLLSQPGGPGASGGRIPVTLSGGMPVAAVDLTNLTSAAQGDPVLLTYFGAIREQIQRTANRRVWMLNDQTAEGTVYVVFVLSRIGEVQSAMIVGDRSVASATLRETALGIIKASGPFPPFPPSFPDSSKAIIVPIEFVQRS